MENNLILFLFLGLFFGVIGGILYVLLAKFLKGELKVYLPQRSYTFGDTIQGRFVLHAKKEIYGDDLSVHLVGYKRESSYGKDGRKHTRRVEFQRFTQHVESEIRYKMGLKKEYKIHMLIPQKEEVFLGQDNIDFGGSTLGKLARFAISKTKRTQLTWQLQVDLETKGLNIHGKKDIFIV